MNVTPANEAIIHKTIKKVTDDIDTLKMNTAIAAMMTAGQRADRQRRAPGAIWASCCCC